MGKIADAIDEIEAELDEANKEVVRLEKEIDSLKDDLADANKTIEWAVELTDYLEEYHPGIITAFEVAQRMEK